MGSIEQLGGTSKPRLNRRTLARFVAAAGISIAGDWVLITAASIAVYADTKSTAAVSALLALVALPTAVLGPLAGAMADRHDRRRLMIGTDLGSAAVLAACIVLSVTGVRLAAVYGAVMLVNVLAAFHRPASEALLPAIAGVSHLGRANSALRTASRLAMIGGPAVAGLLMSNGGFELVLAIDALSFAASALLIATLATASHGGERREPHSPFRSALHGLRYAQRNRRVRNVITAIGTTMLVAQIVNAGTLALVSEGLELPESRYGVLLAFEGAGALGLALLFTYLGPRLPLLSTGSIGLLATGASTMALGVSPGFLAAAAAMAVMGMGVVGLQVAFTSYLQRETADDFRGRVMGLVSVVASVAALVGLTAAGPFVSVLGVRKAFVVAGLVICLSVIPVLTLRRGSETAAGASLQVVD